MVGAVAVADSAVDSVDVGAVADGEDSEVEAEAEAAEVVLPVAEEASGIPSAAVIPRRQIRRSRLIRFYA